MPTTRSKRQAGFGEDTTPPAGLDPQQLLQLLAQQQTVLNQIAQSLVQQTAQQPSPRSTAPPLPAVKSLPLPKLVSPENLTIPQFRDWKLRWNDYSRAQQLSDQPLDTQHGILRSALDSEWTILWSTSRLQISEDSSMAEVIQSMEDYLRRRRNPLLDRHEFHRRDQMTGESVDRYYAALKILDEACAHEEDFRCPTCDEPCITKCPSDDCEETFPLVKHLQETRVRDRLIYGLRDKEMQRRVLTEQFSATLTLEKVLAICTAMENSSTTGATLASSHSTHEVHAASSKSTYKKQKMRNAEQKTPNAQSPAPSTRSSQCNGCGKGPHPRSQCPAWNKECAICGRKGHFRNVCRQKSTTPSRTNQARNGNTPSPPPSSPTTRVAINASAQQHLNILTTIGESKHWIPWLPDTGAEVDAISLQSMKDLGNQIHTLMTTECREVLAANGSSLGPVGSVQATLSLNGRQYTTTLGVYKNVTSPLLSKRGCISLGLIDPQWPLSCLDPAIRTISPGQQQLLRPPPRNPQASESTKKAILLEFQETFNDEVLRPMKGQPMKIELIKGATPFKRYKAHTIPYHWRDLVEKQLQSMVDKGVIVKVPVGEPLDWCHPMVVVAKKGSQESRITVDLTGLNRYVRRPTYPVKVPREVVARIPSG